MVLCKEFLRAIVVFSFWQCGQIVKGLEPLAVTEHGPVRGTIRHAIGSNREVYSYFGIPYGRTPDYTFRFRPPEDPWSWNDVKNVTDETVPFCYQDRDYLKRVLSNSLFKGFVNENHPMTEDCLNLNVFTPKIVSNDTKEKLLPVIVWFHGGSLQVTASTHRMWVLPAYEDVVLVTVQYRLGVFGFLSFDDTWAPPNAGLHDQVKSLHWIKNNIGNFGGDSQSVTLFGLSAGGISTSAHAVSPLSRGLFHRVIASSGVFTIPTIWGQDHRNKSYEISKSLDCFFEDVCYASTCVRNRATSSEVVRSAKNLNAVFSLYQDELFFPDEPDVLIKKNLDPNVPLMIGLVSGEMDYVLLRKFLPETYFGEELDRKKAQEIISQNLEKYYPDLARSSQSVNELIFLYLRNHSLWKDLLHGLSEFYSDAFFNFNAVKFADAAKDNGATVYFYQFATKPDFYNNEILSLKRHIDYERADHGDDQPFYFGFPFLTELDKKGLTFSNHEKRLSKNLMKTLATFAKTGHPVFTKGLGWPEYPSYVDISKNTSVKSKFRFNYLSVWKKLIGKNYEKKLA